MTMTVHYILCASLCNVTLMNTSILVRIYKKNQRLFHSLQYVQCTPNNFQNMNFKKKTDALVPS